MNQQQTTSQKPSEQQINTQPNPDRFVVYNILPGEFGFTIPNCDFVFEFDRHGGWFDEYGNYYNAQGEPSSVPVEYEADVQGDVQYGYYIDEENKDNQSGNNDGKEDAPLEFYDNQHLNKENKETVEKWPEGQNVEVEVHNLSSQWSEDGFEKFLIDNKIEWILFEFEYDEQNDFKGTCYITLDKVNTLRFLDFNGYTMFGKNLNIIVMEPKQQQQQEEVVKESTPTNEANPKVESKPPKEEEKTFENDRFEITFKRPYPDGKPITSSELEKMQKKTVGSQRRSPEKSQIQIDGKNKGSNNGS